MSKLSIPSDSGGYPLHIGNYVKYNGKIWEIADYEDSEQTAQDDNYKECSDLLLVCRSHDNEKNTWIPDYDVEITEYHQSYLEL